LQGIAHFLIAVAISGGIANGTMESAVELVLRFPTRLSAEFLLVMQEYYYDRDQTFIQFMPECARYDPQVIFTLRPGECEFEGRAFKNTFQMNSQGVRDDEASVQSPEIVVLGDSVSMGWGVEQDVTFTSQIEVMTGK
jgi:hypothetical protein